MKTKSITKIRPDIIIPAMGAVEVIIGPRDRLLNVPGGTLSAYFVCVSCDSSFDWRESHEWFECPGCGYELTAPEALQLCENYAKHLEELSLFIGKKYGFWRRLWLRITGRL